MRIVRESPPLMQFLLHRSAHGNFDLLREQQASENVTNRKVDGETVIVNITASSHNTKGTEMLSPDNSMDQNGSNDTDDALSVESFEATKRKNGSLRQVSSMLENVSNGPAYLPPAGNRINRASTPTQDHKSGYESGSSSVCRNPNLITVLDIELRKETGRGLGISVARGPNHIINKGIKVRVFVLCL